MVARSRALDQRAHSRAPLHPCAPHAGFRAGRAAAIHDCGAGGVTRFL